MESAKNMLNITKYLSEVFTKASLAAFKEFLPETFQAQVVWNTTGSSELTTPIAMKIYNMNAKKENFKFPSSKEVAEEIIKNVKDEKGIVEEMKVSIQTPPQKPEKKAKEPKEGDKKQESKKKQKQIPVSVYIDINCKSSWIESESNSILSTGIHVDTPYSGHKILVDFSSPNIAKEMHVGHLRSTILGDSICRILEFLGNDVMRINHVGDWGTQFGMLIAFLELNNPNYADNPEGNENIRDLEEFYKKAKLKFDEDPDFKKKAQLKTVELQKGDANTRKAWQYICQVSRDNFNKIYQRLGIKLTECGESFYDPLCRELIPKLEEQKLLVKDQGCLVFKVPKEKHPLIIVKSDGGIGYDTTDLAALNYRLNTLKRDWVIYTVGGEQEEHLRLIFKAGEICGWHKPPSTRLDHMQFGLVQGKDGKKFSTRKGGNVKLADLLDEAWEDAKKEMKARNEKNNSGMTDEYINTASEKLGYSAVKYYDLKQFRASNYKFDWDKMLDDKGNTAVYLFYTYVRICSIYRKSNLSQEDIDKLAQTEKITITEKAEKSLVLHLLRFNDVIDDLLKDLAINLLCEYVFGIAVKFGEFYESCKIVGNNSRLLITELSRRFMKTAFDLLGLTPIEKI